MIRLVTPLAPALLLTLACGSAGATASDGQAESPTAEGQSAEGQTAEGQAAGDQAQAPTSQPAENAVADPGTAAGTPNEVADQGSPETATADAEAQAAGAAWQTVLTNYVTDDGGFRYAALMASAADMANLVTYVGWAAATDTTGWSREDELSFLMNAYNANTVKSVTDLWPVESVLAEEGFFDAREHQIAGSTMTLNGLENDQIRARFGEPRIHFLVNCASVGCPWLISERITAQNLETLLARQASSYVQRTSVLDRGAGTITVSSIFDWFAGDFEAGGGVRAFLAAHVAEGDAEFVRDEATTIAFSEYDWNLNGRD